MTKSPARHARGRHARPPSEFSTRLHRLIASLRGSRRRRLGAAGAVTATAAVIAAVAVLALPGGSGPAPRAAVAARTAAAPSPNERVGDPDEITDAVPYFETKDPGGKVVEHVTDVRRSGSFVRVYTDLGEADENSEPAIDLCKWTTQFLEDGGDDEPRVFVHGKSDDNGSVVLANKQSDKDDCEVPETP